MSKKVTAWQIIEEMSKRNQKVWLALLSNVVSVQSNKKNGKVEFGVPLEMSNALLNNPRNNGGFLLIDGEQYDAMQIELETKKPKILLSESYADNGEFSHFELVNTSTGDIIWEGTEDETFYGKDKIVQKVSNALMDLSNVLNDEDSDIDDVKAFLPLIRSFIARTTGL